MADGLHDVSTSFLRVWKKTYALYWFTICDLLWLECLTPETFSYQVWVTHQTNLCDLWVSPAVQYACIISKTVCYEARSTLRHGHNTGCFFLTLPMCYCFVFTLVNYFGILYMIIDIDYFVYVPFTSYCHIPLSYVVEFFLIFIEFIRNVS